MTTEQNSEALSWKFSRSGSGVDLEVGRADIRQGSESSFGSSARVHFCAEMHSGGPRSGMALGGHGKWGNEEAWRVILALLRTVFRRQASFSLFLPRF